jgi:hypothetical protein
MNLRYTKRKSVYIAGTSLFGALVFVLDWTFKLTGLKIPFPLMGVLRFDPLGIPILISFFLFGIFSGTATSLIAMLSIAFRNPFSGFMKFLAEFTTILGFYIVFRVKGVTDKRWKFVAMGFGILLRVLIMSVTNALLLPLFLPTYYTFDTVIVLLPIIGVFNVIQGAISVFGGFLFYEAVALRFQDKELFQS